MIGQADFGSGFSGNFTIPAGTSVCRIYLNGAGSGGGAGNSNSAGGGGASGAKGLFTIQGTIAGKVLTINLGTPGAGGVAPGGDGTLGSQSTVAFDNGWTLIAGAGRPGYGGNGNPGPGGNSGNIATTGTVPSYVTSFGQFNMGSWNGQSGTTRLYGFGGNQGDTGGGGQGGWWNQNGQAGQGGYLHIECE